ncbi:g2737 [Coccomyxa viridis]|uniref:G2737 protein n=1 Tax=Coccomyxa viridis TaxID=1274662 RepID=A0ABP1FL49_9CHLO
MATSAQVLHCPPGAHAARRHFGNALHSQAVRHSLKGGAGRAFQPQPRGTAIISAAGDSSRQSVEDRKASSGEASSSEGFSGLVNNLLFGAASSLERGDATCAKCRGAGALSCPSCKGAGVTNQKVRMNQIRHAFNRVKNIVGIDSASMYDTQWQMSNRCRKCHGQGRVLCSTCNGYGSRGPSRPVSRNIDRTLQRSGPGKH